MDLLNKNKRIYITYITKKEENIKQFLKIRVGKAQYLNLIRHGKLFINDVETIDFNQNVAENTKIELVYKRQKLANKIPHVDFSNLDIIYEDDHVLVINKNANTLSIPSINNRGFEIVSQQVAAYLASNKLFEPIHILTRLDADTTGCMVFAKDSFTHAQLSKQQQEDKITKIYECVTCGKDLQPQLIDLPIGRDLDSILKRKIDLENGKESRSLILDVKQLNQQYKLLKIQLLTGRSHQIRVHLKALDNEIVGDTLYGTNEETSRQLLHCSQISFYDIETNELICVNAPFKDDMKNFIEKQN